MDYGSVCSGIEAASVAWEALGWKPVWFAEIENFPSAVLAHHWPHVENHGDMTKLKDLVELGLIDAPSLLVGGTPCQAFSVAGLRGGLSDERGQLTLEYVRLLNAIDERRKQDGMPEAICVWENVPGVLSTSDNAFGCFLAALAGEDGELVPTGKRWSNAGYVLGPQRSIAWRVLDAQYFGVAQRRRRVFLIASAREGFDPAEILFEFEGVRRDSPPRREAGQDLAGTLEASLGKSRGAGTPVGALTTGFDTVGTLDARTQGGGFPGTDGACQGHVVPVVGTITATYGEQAGRDLAEMPGGLQVQCVTGEITHTLNTANNGKGCSEDGTGRGVPTIAFSAKDHGGDALVDCSPTLRAGGHSSSHANAGVMPAIAFAENSRSEVRLEGGDGSRTGALSTGGGKPGQGTPMVAQGLAVRRLTPTECERLQGFPDGHTMLARAGKEAADGPRYKAIGNSKAVPVVRWLGYRIQQKVEGTTDAP